MDRNQAFNQTFVKIESSLINSLELELEDQEEALALPVSN